MLISPAVMFAQERVSVLIPMAPITPGCADPEAPTIRLLATRSGFCTETAAIRLQDTVAVPTVVFRTTVKTVSQVRVTPAALELHSLAEPCSGALPWPEALEKKTEKLDGLVSE